MLFRSSIVVKGIEAVVTECVMSATHYGVDENVLKSLNETFSNVQFEKLASYLVSRVAVHGERRAREMEEVVKTVEEAGVDAFTSAATVRRMDWSSQLGLRELFGVAGPANYQEFVDQVKRIAPITEPK